MKVEVLEVLANYDDGEVARVRIGDVDDTVIVKSLRGNYASSRLLQLGNEHLICSQLEGQHARTSLGLKRIEGRHSLILAYVHGQEVATAYKNTDRTLADFFSFAVAICRALESVHSQGVIHRDLNPSNMVMDDNGIVTIIDFGIARRLDSRVSHQSTPEQLEGTLSYLSPEQTGRMNRNVDYRSDLYSLGVVFYELLSGRLPFDNESDLELVHAHLARVPDSVQQYNTRVPDKVAELVAKLLAKNPSTRYQSATGLLSDLTVLQQRFEAKENLDDFSLGTRDHSGRLIIPEKLYGREQELATIGKSFSAAINQRCRLLLVGGYSGVGKTALIEEMHQPIAENFGVFVSGKFGQYQRNIPYYAIRQAFNQWWEMQLAQRADDYKRRIHKLQKYLGDEGHALADVLPDLDVLVKNCPPVPDLEAQDSLSRQQRIFQRFLRGLADERPIVLFLDDIQWADGASLTLLKSLLLSPELTNVLLVGAFRDNEIGAGHSLPLLIEEVRDKGGLIDEIKLQPLPKEDIQNLLDDTYQWESGDSKALAELIYNKTRGNAFFVKEFIKNIHEKGHSFFDIEKGAWLVDLDKVKSEEITDNVVDLLAGYIDTLPQKTKASVQMGACLGNRFSLEELALLLDQSLEETLQDLWPAIQNRMIHMLNPEHELLHSLDGTTAVAKTVHIRFGHDRIQQATYQSLDEEAQGKAHSKIGLRRLSSKNGTSDIFEILNHINPTVAKAWQPIDNEELLALNLEAAERALETAAFDAANDYITLAQSLCSEETDETTSLHVVKVAAEVNFLNGELVQCEELVRQALDLSKTMDDQVDLYYLLMLRQALSSQNDDAIATARKALQLLDFDFPSESLEDHIGTHLQWIMEYFAASGIATLFDREEMSDPKAVSTIKILDNLSMPTYVSGQVNLWILHVLLKVRLSIEKGLRAESGYAFSELGLILCIQEMFDPAFACADLSQRLSEHFSTQSVRHKGRSLHLIANYISPWRMHLRDTAPINNASHEASLSSGEVVFIGYTIFHPFYNQFYIGEKTLPELAENLPDSIQFAKAIRHDLAYNSLRGMQMLIADLTTTDGALGTFSVPEFDEPKLLEEAQSGLDYYSICIWYVFKAKLLYLYGLFEEAREALEAAEPTLAVLSGHVASLSTYIFTQALLLLQKIEGEDKITTEDQEALDGYLQKLSTWAKVCPANFQHKYLLIKAMAQTRTDDVVASIQNMQEAIASAQTYGYTVEEAIAHEALGRYLIEKGLASYSEHHIGIAISIYKTWGAARMVNILQHRYDQQATTVSQTLSSTSTSASKLDYQSILKASQASSAELELQPLLNSHVKILMENAGAEKAVLVILREDDWSVRALATTEDEVIDLSEKGLSDSMVPSSLIRYVINADRPLVLDNALHSRFSNDPYIRKAQTKSILAMPVHSSGSQVAVIYLENNLTTAAFTEALEETLRILATQMGISINNATLYERLTRLYEAYRRFLPTEFLETLNYNSILDVKLGDQVSKEMTVMFSDIRDYTSLSETMSPEDNFNFINAYLKRVTPNIDEHGGFINQYYGDGLMAMFSDPGGALDAAIGMRRALLAYNVARIAKNRRTLQMGIGLHTGRLMLGVIGDEDRHDVTVISDVVNAASRIEGLSKIFGVGIVVSEKSMNGLVRSRYKHRLLGQVQVIGKNRPLKVFEVYDGEEDADIEAKDSTLKSYSEAMTHYLDKNFAEAAVLLRKVLDVNAEDRPAQYYIEKAAHYLVHGVPPDWTGVEIMQFK